MTSSDKVEIPRGMFWSVLGVLITVVFWLGWTHISFRLSHAENVNCEQDKVIVKNQLSINRNQLSIEATLEELKIMRGK